MLALFLGLYTQLLSLAVQKAGGRPGRIYHVMCATADVIYARLSLVSPRIYVAAIARARCWHLQPRRLYGVCDPFAWLGAVTKTISLTWVCVYVSSTHHMINPSRPFSHFSYCKRQKLGVEAWERGYFVPHCCSNTVGDQTPLYTTIQELCPRSDHTL